MRYLLGCKDKQFPYCTGPIRYSSISSNAGAGGQFAFEVAILIDCIDENIRKWFYINCLLNLISERLPSIHINFTLTSIQKKTGFLITLQYK